MTQAQYMRVESHAGGVPKSARQFIKASHSLLAEAAKKRDYRYKRHAWIRAGLAHYAKAVELHNL